MYQLNIELVKKCDILLTTTPCFFSKVIRIATKSDISHASLMVEQSCLIDSTSDLVQSRNVKRIVYNDDCAIHLMRYKEPLTSKQQDTIINYVRCKIGMSYNTIEAILSKWEMPLFDNKMFCSRLVAKAYSEAGINLVNDPRACTPNDLLHSPMLEEIKEISLPYQIDYVIYGHDYDEDMRQRTQDLMSRVKKIDSSIDSLNDIIVFLIKHPEKDQAVLNAYKESRYLELSDELFAATKDDYDHKKLLRKYGASGIVRYCMDTVREDDSRFDANYAGYRSLAEDYGLETFNTLRDFYEKEKQRRNDRKMAAIRAFCEIR